MDNQGWIKLHRKLADHEILKDATSLQIFVWLLLSVDRNTGKYTTGRFVASQVLGMKPRTFHKALSERLQHRYNLVTLSSDNKKTTISLNNWDKYQLSSDTSSDKLVTPKGQQSDTKQEVRSKNKENIYRYIDSLNEELSVEVAKQYSVSLVAVRKLSEDLKLYCQSKGKKYANYKAALQNWVRRAIDEKKITKINTTVVDDDPDYDPEVARQNIEKLREMRNGIIKSI